MINDVGKTSVSIRMNGCVINMFNTTVASNQSLTFLDENDHVKFKYTVNEDGLGSRALFYTYSFSTDRLKGQDLNSSKREAQNAKSARISQKSAHCLLRRICLLIRSLRISSAKCRLCSCCQTS